MELHERYLMCPPEFYQIDYVINPWMEGNIDRASATLAAEQWQEPPRYPGPSGGRRHHHALRGFSRYGLHR